MSFVNNVYKKYETISSFLKWMDDYNSEDVGDAIDQINLMRNRRMEKGISDAEFEHIEERDPRKLLPASAFKGKAFGWLKTTPKEQWPEVFNKYIGRNLDHLFENEANWSPVVIDDELGDGYGRVHLAYALGEKLPVAVFKGIK